LLRAPSRRKKSKEVQKLNLIPILDAVFIFIFFLLSSTTFLKIYEIPSDVAIINNNKPLKKKVDRTPTVRVLKNGFSILSGKNPLAFIKKVNGKYDYENLHSYMVRRKRTTFKNEKTIVLEPLQSLSYDDVVKVMDAIEILRRTDPAKYIKQKFKTFDGKIFEQDKRVWKLFESIIFSDLQS
jgi:biopolymer transport protein ExbD